MHRLTPQQIAEELDIEARALTVPSTEALRRVRRRGTRDLRARSGEDVIAVALSLVGRHRWMAYELVYHHRAARSLLDAVTVETLGEGFAGWGDVDPFARYIPGPAWQQRLLDDDLIARWARSPDRWWRRAALVSTVPLNLRSAGGTGDTDRTLTICGLLVKDRDDLVVKALSWALRELVVWDPDAVRAFLHDHETQVAARVRREVDNKLRTGRKHPAR